MTRKTKTAPSRKPTIFSVDPDLDNLITRYDRSAYRFFSSMDYADIRTLGVKVIEGECPGSTYFAAELRIPIEEANARAEAAGIPVRFKLKAKKPLAQEENLGRELSENPPAPEQKIFGGKGIVIPFMFNIPDVDGSATNSVPTRTPGQGEPDPGEEEQL